MTPPTKPEVPAYDQLFNPTLRVLHRLGGSASLEELHAELITELNVPEDVAEMPHGKGSQTELEYRAAWARTYLKKVGLLENSERGVWALTPEGVRTHQVDGRKVVRSVRDQHREKRKERQVATPETGELDGGAAKDWQEELMEVLIEMRPDAFERLCQRLLRESGFIEVEVTGRSGDGGIDGHGIVRIAGLISFPVLFQSKRYQGNIGPNVVRDFRGAMVGRADKGLLITTGGFTREARREATRDGAPPIDLIDGDLLATKLKDTKLGVHTKLVEEVEIDSDWFSTL